MPAQTPRLSEDALPLEGRPRVLLVGLHVVVADDAVVLGLVEPAPPSSAGEPAAKKRRT